MNGIYEAQVQKKRMAIPPDVYPGRKTTQCSEIKTTKNPEPEQEQSLLQPRHLPRMHPTGTATGYNSIYFHDILYIISN